MTLYYYLVKYVERRVFKDGYELVLDKISEKMMDVQLVQAKSWSEAKEIYKECNDAYEDDIHLGSTARVIDVTRVQKSNSLTREDYLRKRVESLRKAIEFAGEQCRKYKKGKAALKRIKKELESYEQQKD